MAIFALFDVSIDELLSNKKGAGTKIDYLFESVMEYDIDMPKRYDMKFGGAKQLALAGYDGEKIRVRLASNTLPSPYIGKVELAVNAETVELYSLECDSVELDIKTRNVLLDDVTGTVGINCNLDMNVICRSLKGEIAINQIAATSKICVPEGTVFTAVTKGIGTSISFEKDGKPADAVRPIAGPICFYRWLLLFRWGTSALLTILPAAAIEGARSFLCAEFSDQRKSDGISDDLGIREK